MPFPILALPRELRDMIYVDAFHPPTRGYITPYTSSYSSSSSSSLSRPSADDFLPPVALLRTSRQVNAEAKGVLEQWRRAVVERKKREWTFAVNELRMDAFGDGDEEYDDRVEMGERFGMGWGVL